MAICLMNLQSLVKHHIKVNRYTLWGRKSVIFIFLGFGGQQTQLFQEIICTSRSKFFLLKRKIVASSESICVPLNTIISSLVVPGLLFFRL